MDWTTAAVLAVLAHQVYSARRTRHVAPGTTNADPDSLEDVEKRLGALEGQIAALQLEWTNSLLQFKRLAARLARYAGDAPPEPQPAAAQPVRRTLTFAEVHGAASRDRQ